MATRPSLLKQCAAFFCSALIIFQSCISAAYAAQSVPQGNLQSAARSPLFKPSADSAYTLQPIDQAATQEATSQHIASFHEKMRLAGLNVGKPTQIPIAGDITIFIPVYLPGKIIGDNYVQNRLVRQQVFDLLGRHIIYANESGLTENEQINRLYNNAWDFANSSKIAFGQVLDPAQVEQFARDIIWPEYRVINGQTTLVPVLYLTAATINANKVQGTRTEFSGESASLKSVTLDGNVLTLGAKTLLNARTNISLANGAAIKSPGDVNLTLGGTLDVIGSSIDAGRNLNITANQLNVKTTLVPFKDRFGTGTRLGQIGQITAGSAGNPGSIVVKTGQGITFEGANATANGGGISFTAGGDIVVASIFANSSSQSEMTQSASVNVIGSKLSAQDTIRLISDGQIYVTASELISTQGGIELLAKNGIHIVEEFSQEQIQRVIRQGKTSGSFSSFQTHAVRAVLKAGKGVLLDTQNGDVLLRAANITSQEGAQVRAQNGKVRLLMTQELEQSHLQTVRKGTWTIKTRTEDIIKETNIPNTIVGGLQVQATYGIDVEYTGKEGASLREQIEVFRKMPGMEWMATLHDQAIAQAGPGFNWQEVEEVHKELRKTSRSLSPAAMALVAIAVAVAMGPGAGLIGANGGGIIGGLATGATNATIGAALNAGALTLATQATQSLAAGNSLRATLSAMDSSESMRSLAISMVTAGAMQEVNLPLFKVPDESLFSFTNLAKQAGQAVVNASVSAAISVSINGGNSDSYKKAFITNLATDAVNTIGTAMVGKISAANSLGDATKYIAHAAMGCMTQGLTAKLTEVDAKNACASGAAGAVVAQGLADLVEAKSRQLADSVLKKTPDANPMQMASTLSFLAKNGVDVSRLIAAFAAFGAHGDVNAAAGAAGAVANSYRENMLNAAMTAGVVSKMGLAVCGAEGISACANKSLEKQMRDHLSTKGFDAARIERAIQFLKSQTPFFNNFGDAISSYLTTGAISAVVPSKPNVTIDESGAVPEVVFEGSWDPFLMALHDTGVSVGKATKLKDEVASEAINFVLNSDLGQPIRWAATVLDKAGEKAIAAVPGLKEGMATLEQLSKARGVAMLAVVHEAGYKDYEDYLSWQPNEENKPYHEEATLAASGFETMMGMIGGIAPLANLANTLKMVPALPNTSPGRAFDNLPSFNTLVELQRLRREGHAVERHGGAVTDEQLIRRATTGVAPDGSDQLITKGKDAGKYRVPTSTAFHSNELLVSTEKLIREKHLQQALNHKLVGDPKATQVEVEIDVGVNLGRGYKPANKLYDPNNPGQQGMPTRIDNLTGAKAVFRLDSATGQWALHTMYPVEVKP